MIEFIETLHQPGFHSAEHGGSQNKTNPTRVLFLSSKAKIAKTSATTHVLIINRSRGLSLYLIESVVVE